MEALRGQGVESGVRSQESGVRSQESGVRSQESGVRSQESGVRSQAMIGRQITSSFRHSFRIQVGRSFRVFILQFL
jgi:hypothetical protein